MRAFLFLIVLLCADSCFAADPMTRIRIGEAGKDKWLSTEDLDAMATAHVKEKDKEFKRDGLKATIWIDPSDGETTVHVVYSQGLGKPMWRVYFSREGKITKYFSGIARG